MAMCKFCGKAFTWGDSGERWVPLVPVGEDEGLDRAFQDENGVLRADHRTICTNKGGPAVRISKLARTVKGSDVLTWTKPDEDGVVFPKIEEKAG